MVLLSSTSTARSLTDSLQPDTTSQPHEQVAIEYSIALAPFARNNRAYPATSGERPAPYQPHPSRRAVAPAPGRGTLTVPSQ